MAGWLFLPATAFPASRDPRLFQDGGDLRRHSAGCALFSIPSTLLVVSPQVVRLAHAHLVPLPVCDQFGGEHRHLRLVLLVGQPDHYLGHALFHRPGLLHRCRGRPRTGDRGFHQRAGLHSDLPVRNSDEPAALEMALRVRQRLFRACGWEAGGRPDSWPAD